MSTKQDAILLEQLKANDQGALKHIFEQYYSVVYRAIYRLINDQGITEDLAQDVFTRFWEKRQQINIQGALGAYLHRMGVNEALGYIRKHKKFGIEEIEERHCPAISSGESAYMQEELRSEIHKAIKNLPPKCQQVFVLSRFEELSYKEISEKLQISPKTVENQISKALKVLRVTLKTYLTSLVGFFTYLFY